MKTSLSRRNASLYRRRIQNRKADFPKIKKGGKGKTLLKYLLCAVVAPFFINIFSSWVYEHQSKSLNKAAYSIERAANSILKSIFYMAGSASLGP